MGVYLGIRTLQALLDYTIQEKLLNKYFIFYMHKGKQDLTNRL